MQAKGKTLTVRVHATEGHPACTLYCGQRRFKLLLKNMARARGLRPTGEVHLGFAETREGRARQSYHLPGELGPLLADVTWFLEELPEPAEVSRRPQAPHQ